MKARPKTGRPKRTNLIPDHVGTCPTCGKLRYTSRKNAKAAMKRFFPGDHQATYQCTGYWHHGHLGSPIMRGVQERNLHR